MSSTTRRHVLKMGILTAAASAATNAGGPWVARAQSKQLVVCSWGGARATHGPPDRLREAEGDGPERQRRVGPGRRG